MAHLWAEHRAPNYEKFAKRPTPPWFKDAKLGIFVHWGPYSVPAWAPPVGEIGRLPEEETHIQNPYAEWYFNSMRFPEGPTGKHHKEVYGDAPYDDFLDKWTAKDFNAKKMVGLFSKAGAKYVVPVTKHHDGVTLWDAPGTKDRNTVHRGPKRDLVKEFADACQSEGVKFGLYYSTGIDWHYWPTSVPWSKGHYDRPGIDAVEYNEYAWKHCQDLIDKYQPYVLWGDIDWPKCGVEPGPYSVESLLDILYEKNPEAVINDRFGDTHWDFTTVEYGLGAPPKESDQMWQNTRGIGLSFGYNQIEDESHYMSGKDALRLLIDVSSAGGNLLLNVGPDGDGNLPPLQLKCLEALGEWMDRYGDALNASRPVMSDLAEPVGDDKTTDLWLRWTKIEDQLFAFIDGQGKVKLPLESSKVDLASARQFGGSSVEIGQDGCVDLDSLDGSVRPICLELAINSGNK